MRCKCFICGSRTCKPNSVCGIAPAGRSFLWAAHYCEAQATYPEVVTRRAGTFSRAKLSLRLSPSLFGLAPCGVCPARCITAAAVRSYRTFSPLPRCRGRYVFCGTSRQPGLNPASRTLSGTLLCGVRTFLPRRPKAPRATVRSSCLQDHYMRCADASLSRRDSTLCERSLFARASKLRGFCSARTH